MDDLLADFVAETREMLEASSGEIVAWEANPADTARLDAIFRFVHTVKGNCGFFDFPRLARLSHAAEDALADCRAGRRAPDHTLVSAVLAVIDRIVAMVDDIEAGNDLSQGGAKDGPENGPEDQDQNGDDALIAALEPDDDTITAASQEEARAAIAANTRDGAPSEVSQPQTAANPSQNPDTSPSDSGLSNSAPSNSATPQSPSSQSPSSQNSPSQNPAVQRSIRLPVDLLDRVMSGVSDMVLARNDLAHRLRQAGTQPTIDGPFERLTTILSDVRDAITRMRMQRIETLFSAFPRLVRDLSHDLGKQVMIDIEGGDVELDREMIEMIRDPMTHIIRNCVDHGIEPPSDRLKLGKREIGFLSIAARQSGNMISIVVSDDGRGLARTKIAAKAFSMGLITKSESEEMGRDAIMQLIFRAGFSTAEKVSAVSGRGVGLDVVQQNLRQVGGAISVKSDEGVGTQFTMQIPLTLSIIAGLTVDTSGQRFAIPQGYIEEIIHSTSKSLDFTRVGETALITFRGKRVPCIMLCDALGLEKSQLGEDDYTMVMLRLANGDMFALAVDGIHSHGDIVVKPLAPAVMNAGIYAGSTLLDDGQPVLLLDVTAIAAEHNIASDLASRVVKSGQEDPRKTDSLAPRAMLFKDLDGRELGVRLELVLRIETIAAGAVDRSGVAPRAILDGTILPLAGLSPKPLAQEPLETEKLRLLRLSDGSSQLLYAVREVEEVVELDSSLKPAPDEPLIEAVILVAERTISLIDGHELFAKFGETPEFSTKPLCRLPEGEWARTILAPLVASAGYDICTGPKDGCEEDGSGDGPEHRPEDVAIWFDDEYEAAAKQETQFSSPVVRLRDTPGAPDPADGSPSVYRYDREGLVNALEQVTRQATRQIRKSAGAGS